MTGDVTHLSIESVRLWGNRKILTSKIILAIKTNYNNQKIQLVLIAMEVIQISVTG